MIEAHFRYAGQKLVVQVIEEVPLFYDENKNMLGIQLSQEGVIKEHPDLKDDPEWKQKAILRFMEHIKNLPSEKARMDYIITELKQKGYQGLYQFRKGFRPTKI